MINSILVLNGPDNIHIFSIHSHLDTFSKEIWENIFYRVTKLVENCIGPIG